MRNLLTAITFAAAHIGEAFAQPSAFRHGSIYVSVNYEHGERSWLQEIDPVTGEMRIIADHLDGLWGPNGLAFTPDAKRLRVLNYFGDNVMDFDAVGNGVVVYDSADGIVAPFGQNGVIFDDFGRCYVSNDGSLDLLRFPAIGDVAEVIGPGTGSLAFGPHGELFFATGTYRIIRIDLDGTYVIFEDFPINHGVATITSNLAGDLFVGVSGPIAGGWYRYDQARLENKRFLAPQFASGTNVCAGMSADDTEVYVTNIYSVFAMNAQTGDWRSIYDFPGLENGFGGRGIATYIAPKPGDMNCDRSVNAFDIQPFIAALTSRDAYDAAYPACDWTRADLNADGTVNTFDIQPFVDLLQ